LNSLYILQVQGNEFSLHMLLASDFMLNASSCCRPLRISPWIGTSCNINSFGDPARVISVPDVDPDSMLTVAPSNENSVSPEFSMAAGDFVSIYSKETEFNRWDSVASCFFLDTAPSIVEYLQVIWNMLVEGGVLVNFGPLLFHWSKPPSRPDESNNQNCTDKDHAVSSPLDKRYQCSVDVCYEDLKVIMINMGFEIVEEKSGIDALYTADTLSMMNSHYRCVYFVARKRVV